MERENDVQLIYKILSGNDEAFATLVRRHQKGVHALAWRKVGDFHAAEEITQDTFLQVYRKLTQLKNPNQFSGWMYVIASRLCLKWIRKNKVVTESFDDTHTGSVERASYNRYVSDQREMEDREHRREVVKKLLSRLPESERTVVTLHYLSEMKVKEIGKFLGVSANTIKSRLRRGRKRLQEQGEEVLVRETLQGIQFPADVTARIMRQVADMKPAPVPVGKPLLPWAALGTAAVLVLFMLGASHQYLARFQKPYSFEADAEPTIEIIDTLIVLDTPAKPAVRNQVGRDATHGKNSSTGAQAADTTPTSVASEDATTFSTAQWTQGNTPPAGYVRNIFAASDGDLYTVSPTGIYRTSVDATRWTRVNTDVPYTYDPMPITEHNGRLYIVSNDEIFTSADRGATWQTLGPRPKGRAVGFVIIDAAEQQDRPADMTMYLAVRDTGVFQSIDNGAHWDPLNNGLADRILTAAANIEKTVFVGTESGLYRLESDTWKKLSLGTSDAICSLTVSGQNLYAGTAPEILVRFPLPIDVEQAAEEEERREYSVRSFRSSDLGDSWSEIMHVHTSRPMMLPSGVMVLDVDETLLVLGVFPSRSTDGGQTWTKLEFDQHFTTVSSLGVAAVNEQTFYKVGVFGIQRTTDAGESWHLFMDGMLGTRMNELVAFNDNLYAFTGYEVHESTDNGVSWEKIWIDGEDNAGIGYKHDSKLLVDDGTLYFVSLAEEALRISRLSADDNRLIPMQGVPAFDDTLSLKLWKDGEKALDMDVSKGHDMRYIVFEEGVRSQTTAVSDGTFYVEYRRRLFKWKPGEPKWTNMGLIDTSRLLDGEFRSGFKLAVSGETVYVGKRDGTLFQSLDGGNSWRDVTPSLPLGFAFFKEIVFVGSTVYVATDKGVLRSETGAHWRVLTDSAGVRPIIVKFAVDMTTVYGISDEGAYRLDAQNQWEKISSGTLGEVASLVVMNDRLYSASANEGIFHISLAEGQ
ncbi:hypothetical protein C6496_07680 [Candidatus Poribacteria bacterium]|nr:MAG: hypothetical protein C6496_07680 [Candidatus Poribacteria bacterium]